MLASLIAERYAKALLRAAQADNSLDAVGAQAQGLSEALRAAEPEMMRAAQHGILHKNTASRKVSRLAMRIRALSA